MSNENHKEPHVSQHKRIKSLGQSLKKGINIQFLKIKNKIGKEGIKKDSRDIDEYSKVKLQFKTPLFFLL